MSENQYTSSVSVVKCASYEPELISQALHTALSYFGGIFALVKPGQRVLIKMNMLNASQPEHAVTTHPNLIIALCKLIKHAGAIPFVGDSPALGLASKNAIQSGLMAQLQEIGVEMVDLKTPLEIKNPNGVVSKKLLIAKEVTEFDVLFNLPKFKTHNITLYTAAIKNLFGVIPGVRKAQYHLEKPGRADFTNLLVDIASMIRPTINILDMIIAMEGAGGPAAGIIKPIGLLLASEDIAAIDAVACEIVGIPQSENLLLKFAKERGIGETDLTKINIRGSQIEEVRVKDFKRIEKIKDTLLPAFIPSWLVNWFKTLFLERPIINELKCIQCGSCIAICPAKAIKAGRRKPEIDYLKCIRCFCCQESCVSKAIDIDKSFIGKML